MSKCPTVKLEDDIATYNALQKIKPSAADLQQPLNYSVQWSEDNNILLNTEKTQLLKLSPSKQKSVDNCHINSDSIQSSDSCKLLGVTKDYQLSFSEHVDDIVTSSSFKQQSMCRLKRMGVSEKFLLTFYISHILSLITYAALACSSLI